jgi:large subunit ribosomal protein L9
MANIEVLLIKPVRNLGNEGEAVKVKAGYARNFLLPQGLALPVNRSTKRQLDVLATRRAERLSKELADAKATAEKLSALVVVVSVKTGEDGKPHGAITNMEIHKAIVALGFPIERHHIKIGEPLKTLGEHAVTVKVHPEVTAEVKINVVSENPIVEKKDEDFHKKGHKFKSDVRSEKTEAAVEKSEETSSEKKEKKKKAE